MKKLAANGNELLLAVRDYPSGWELRREILTQSPQAKIHVQELNLASLHSIREFATQAVLQFPQIDGLINNAEVVNEPRRKLTLDRFEAHFGVNHLGHFALTGLLTPNLSPNARVLTVFSPSYRFGEIKFHDLRWDHSYTPLRAYASSKLANLLFAYELDRKSKAEGLGIKSLAVSPGYTNSAQAQNTLFSKLRGVFLQNEDEASNTILFALNSSELQGGETIVPGNLMNLNGPPTVVDRPKIRNEEAIARRLWLLSGQLTRINW